MLLAFLFLAACGGKHSGTYEVKQATGSAEQAAAARAEADALWAERSDKAKLQAALAKYEAAFDAEPTNREVAAQLVRGWYFLGDGHETEVSAKIGAWAKSVEFGARCLALNHEFTVKLAAADEATAAAAANAEDVPCLYWTATALGKWAKASGIAKTLKHMPTVKAYIGRVEQLDPTYFYHGPARYWGAYYAAIPSFAGQDLKLSKEYFDKSVAGSPQYFGTRVLIAEFWAVKTQNKDEFLKNLQWVLDQDPNATPEIAPEQRAEQGKARALLAQQSDLFAD
jgi:hypothetical protein